MICGQFDYLYFLPLSLQVISPTSEHLFQALSSQDQEAWVKTLQNCTAQAIKSSSGRQMSAVRVEKMGESEAEGEAVPDAMSLILAVPGNRTCADCSSSGNLTFTRHFYLRFFPPSFTPLCCLQLWSGPVSILVWWCVSNVLESTEVWGSTCPKSDLSTWTSGTDTLSM